MSVLPGETGLGILSGALAGTVEAQREQREVEFRDKQFDEGKRQFDEGIALELQKLDEMSRQFDMDQQQKAHFMELRSKIEQELTQAQLGVSAAQTERQRQAQLHISAEREKSSRYSTRVAEMNANINAAHFRAQAMETDNIIKVMDRIRIDEIPKYAVVGDDGSVTEVPEAALEQVRSGGYQLVENPRRVQAYEAMADHLQAYQTDPMIRQQDREQTMAMAREMLDNEQVIRDDHFKTMSRAFETQNYAGRIGYLKAQKEYEEGNIEGALDIVSRSLYQETADRIPSKTVNVMYGTSGTTKTIAHSSVDDIAQWMFSGTRSTPGNVNKWYRMQELYQMAMQDKVQWGQSRELTGDIISSMEFSNPIEKVYLQEAMAGLYTDLAMQHEYGPIQGMEEIESPAARVAAMQEQQQIQTPQVGGIAQRPSPRRMTQEQMQGEELGPVEQIVKAELTPINWFATKLVEDIDFDYNSRNALTKTMKNLATVNPVVGGPMFAGRRINERINSSKLNSRNENIEKFASGLSALPPDQRVQYCDRVLSDPSMQDIYPQVQHLRDLMMQAKAAE